MGAVCAEVRKLTYCLGVALILAPGEPPLPSLLSEGPSLPFLLSEGPPSSLIALSYIALKLGVSGVLGSPKDPPVRVKCTSHAFSDIGGQGVVPSERPVGPLEEPVP